MVDFCRYITSDLISGMRVCSISGHITVIAKTSQVLKDPESTEEDPIVDMENNLTTDHHRQSNLLPEDKVSSHIDEQTSSIPSSMLGTSQDVHGTSEQDNTQTTSPPSPTSDHEQTASIPSPTLDHEQTTSVPSPTLDHEQTTSIPSHTLDLEQTASVHTLGTGQDFQGTSEHTPDVQ